MWSSIISFIPGWAVFVQAAITLICPLGIYFVYRKLYAFVGSGRGPQLNQGHSSTLTKGNKPPGSILSGDYSTDLASIKDRIGMNSDVHFREFLVGGYDLKAALVFVEGMQDEAMINKQVLEPLMSGTMENHGVPHVPQRPVTLSALKERLLPLSEINEVNELEKLQEFILFGYTALIIDGIDAGILVGIPHGSIRAITEPTSEGLLRGPRIAFSEVLSENTSILRRQGLNKNLEMKLYEVGSQVKRKLVIAYIKDIVNPDLLEEVTNRVSKINMDFLAESGYVEQLIEDNYLSPFQQTQNTERPDRVITSLLEGRIGILLDGTPFALIVPVTFSMLLQSPEDYYERWLPGTLLRMLRFFSAFMALLAPALYISFISFHPGLIPTELVISIIETRQGVPFPSLIEVLILEISIEILREAGIRLPKPIGPAMGIVGGLVIGDAAVQAGIVSPFLVIVVAVTAISSFSIPMYSAGITLRILRFVGMLFAAMLGMYGTILFIMLILIHLTKLTSFGVPYVTPFSPIRLSDWKDLYIRAPMSLMKRRPEMMKPQKKKRRS
ncbi:spore germination protein [Paenibacillus sp. sgz5001063]|uniref:spore germination protein n=1 Tax=Paenibacillus sp. sgz5001063 TaxID=3242474 RepID=UPI0036D209BF